MNILILYTKNKEEVFNRKSAIGSYVHCLANLLSNDNSIYLNGELFEKNKSSIKEVNLKSRNKVGSKLTKIIPNYFKRYLSEKKHLKSLIKFKEELIESNVKFDKIIEFYNIGSNVGYELSVFSNIPLFIIYDGPIIEEYTFFNNRKPLNYNLIVKRQYESLKHAKKIIAYSNPMKEYLEEIIGESNDVVIHQNVDFSRFDIMIKDKEMESSGTLNICFIGSFLKWHQVDYLINSFKTVIEKGIDAHLYLVGDGMERVNIQNSVNALKKEIKSKIIFTGFLDGEELCKLKERMHIGVMPGSNWYGAPNKIFEYGGMKLAVLAPDTPTILDLFNMEELSFFKWENNNDLTQKLINLLTDKNKINELSSQLHNKIIAKYNSKNTQSFYQELLTD